MSDKNKAVNIHLILAGGTWTAILWYKLPLVGQHSSPHLGVPHFVPTLDQKP